MMTDSICHLRPISEHQFKFQLYSEFVWCSCRCRNAAYSFCVPPVTTILVGKWQFSSAELPQRNLRQQCRNILFLTKSRYSSRSIFIEVARLGPFQWQILMATGEAAMAWNSCWYTVEDDNLLSNLFQYSEKTIACTETNNTSKKKPEPQLFRC